MFQSQGLLGDASRTAGAQVAFSIHHIPPLNSMNLKQFVHLPLDDWQLCTELVRQRRSAAQCRARAQLPHDHQKVHRCRYLSRRVHKYIITLSNVIIYWSSCHPQGSASGSLHTHAKNLSELLDQPVRPSRVFAVLRIVDATFLQGQATKITRIILSGLDCHPKYLSALPDGLAKAPLGPTSQRGWCLIR